MEQVCPVCGAGRRKWYRPFAYLGSLLHQVLANQQTSISNQNTLLERTEKIMASQADLDAALQAEGTDIQTAATALQNLESKLSSITPGQPAPDFSAEVAQIGQFRSALQTLAANMGTDASNLGGSSSGSTTGTGSGDSGSSTDSGSSGSSAPAAS